MSRRAASVSDSQVTRTLSQLSDSNTVRISIDLVPAVRRTIAFLRAVSESTWLHETAAVSEAVRRYDELWMPLACEMAAGTAAPMILPPIDIEWVWFCHSLNPESYWDYCDAKFSKLIPKAAIFDEENEEYALLRCKEIWSQRYPDEPFENEGDSKLPNPSSNKNEWLVSQVMKQRFLYSKFSQPYMIETMYLIAANQRYKGFVHVLGMLSDWNSRFVPTIDILIMWITHQSYPIVYADDLRSMERDAGKKIQRPWESAEEDEIEETKKLWERTFDQPYEKAGGHIALTRKGIGSEEPMLYWEVFDSDVNTKYKSLAPRFLLEVSVFVRLNLRMKLLVEETRRDFLRLGVTRCHRKLKIDLPIETIPYDSWKEACHLYCEFATRGITLELRRRGGSNCFGGSAVKNTVAFLWNDLLRAPTLTLGKEIEHQISIVASITPPAQAPYLLKCVPDRVTDDSGTMISDVILKMNNYRPQEGRWLSRTVLNHGGRECFVVRMRIGEGFWRRGGEAPSTVKWEDRIIEIREGGWSYVAGSIGKAPVKVVGTATPKQPVDPWNTAWKFSTGEELMMAWQSPNTAPTFCLKNQTSSDYSSVKLLRGRRMQYRVRKLNKDDDMDQEDNGVEGADFLTLVRFTEDNPPVGRATALINWKLQVVEFVPEEDAVLVLLLCVSILRSVYEIREEDVGNLLMRRRLKETSLGERDWGSVILHRPIDSSSSSSFFHPWYWNAKAVMASDRSETFTKQPGMSYSPAEGGDGLYRRGLLR